MTWCQIPQLRFVLSFRTCPKPNPYRIIQWKIKSPTLPQSCWASQTAKCGFTKRYSASSSRCQQDKPSGIDTACRVSSVVWSADICATGIATRHYWMDSRRRIAAIVYHSSIMASQRWSFKLDRVLPSWPNQGGFESECQPLTSPNKWN